MFLFGMVCPYFEGSASFERWGLAGRRPVFGPSLFFLLPGLPWCEQPHMQSTLCPLTASFRYLVQGGTREVMQGGFSSLFIPFSEQQLAPCGAYGTRRLWDMSRSVLPFSALASTIQPESPQNIPFPQCHLWREWNRSLGPCLTLVPSWSGGLEW